jgi:hypothetical protein
MIDHALKYFNKGFRVIPITKAKSPATKEWKSFQEVQLESDIKSIFSGREYGLAVLMTEGYEALDFDSKNDLHARDLYIEFVTLLQEEYPTVAASIKNKVWSQRTPSGGAHILFRSHHAEGNQKLAISEDKKVLIETRGVGGYIAITPTQGYRAAQELDELPYISAEERELLILLAKCFTEDTATVSETTVRNEPFELADKFNADHDWKWMVDALTGEGWTIIQESPNSIKLKRPGKTEPGWSAELKKNHSGIGLFRNFSTDAWPFEDKCYDAYGVWATIEYGADWSSAAKEARKMYPNNEWESPISKSTDTVSPPPFIKEILANRFDYDAQPPEEQPRIVYHWAPPRRGTIPLAVDGSVCVVKGQKGARKSFFINQLESNALSGSKVLGFEVDLHGKKILHIDTEMEGYFLDRRARKVIDAVGKERAGQFILHGVAKYTPKERREFITWAIEKEYKDQFGLIVIDVATDLVRDINDTGESTDLRNWLAYIGEISKAPTLNVIHNNPGSEKGRGHAGTEFGNKASVEFNISMNAYQETTLKCTKTRGGPWFPTMHFTQDEYGNLRILESLTSDGPEYKSRSKKL